MYEVVRDLLVAVVLLLAAMLFSDVRLPGHGHVTGAAVWLCGVSLYAGYRFASYVRTGTPYPRSGPPVDNARR